LHEILLPDCSLTNSFWLYRQIFRGTVKLYRENAELRRVSGIKTTKRLFKETNLYMHGDPCKETDATKEIISRFVVIEEADN
jgi:hypothetical protein